MAHFEGSLRLSLGPLLIGLGLALAGGCEHSKIVYLDDEVPLAAPLEGDFGHPDGQPGDERDDPPSRVARVSFLDGQVSVQPGGAEAWSPAAVNLPLKDGDALWAAQGGRAELQVGPTGLRASDDTSLTLVRIAGNSFQVGLDQGAMMLRVLPGALRDAVEVDTPAGAVNVSTPGSYRVDMDPVRPDGSVTVRSGRAEVTVEGEVIPVGPGQRILLTGGEQPSYQLVEAPAQDAFETWSEDRDRRGARSVSAQKLGRAVMGGEDLDAAGAWQVHPLYGDLWVPRVAPGWAPYREGRWAWVDPWGWTWVDDAPWGFAPSHYGRWVNLGGNWGWVPRAPQAQQAQQAPYGRPVYAPALVAFVGQPTGGRLDARFPGGGVAWFPLGPREPYAPAYPVSRTYLGNVNAWARPGQAPAAGAWANQGVPGAMTAVPRATFTSFAPVAAAAVPLAPGRAFLSAPVGGAPALAPTARSVQARPSPRTHSRSRSVSAKCTRTSGRSGPVSGPLASARCRSRCT